MGRLSLYLLGIFLQHGSSALENVSRFCSPAGCAISADFQPRHHDAEAAIFLHLPLQLLENVADKFHDLAAAQACHVDMVAIELTLVVMSLAVNVQEIEFVDQALALEELQRAVNGAAVDGGSTF